MEQFLCCISSSLPSTPVNPYLVNEPLLFPTRQGFRLQCFTCASLTCSDLSTSGARDLLKDFGTHKAKITGTFHDDPSVKLAAGVLSYQLSGDDLHLQTLDGDAQMGLADNEHFSAGSLNVLIGQLGPETDVPACASLLQHCTLEKSLSQGERVHQHMIRLGYADHMFLNNLLVQMYGKCGGLQHAHAVFDNMSCRNSYSWTIMLVACTQNGTLDHAKAVFSEMPLRSVVSWNAMITGCAQLGHSKEALQLFGQMKAEDIKPNKVTFICILDACARLTALEEGRQIHASIIGNCLEHDVVVGTAIVNMYGKCGSPDDAMAVFVNMPQRNVISWSAMIGVCAQNEDGKEALNLFSCMQAEGVEPNRITFICVLDACASTAALEVGREIHASVVMNGWEFDDVVRNALVNMYGKCSSLDDARAVFVEMPRGDVVLWNAMIAACAQNGHGQEALELFCQMQLKDFKPDEITFLCILDACASVAVLEKGREIHANVIRRGCGSDISVKNALINMYGKCGSMDDARAMFAEMPARTVVSWNAMMTVCSQNGLEKEALLLFSQMQGEGFETNKITFMCALDACSRVAALEEGRDIHASVLGNGWESDVVVGSALINMYGKCGCLDDAQAAFAEMPLRDVVLWSAMIAACAQNGYDKEALELFGQMQGERIKPNEVTFVCVLTACSHMGLVADGRRYFASMSRDYGITPLVDHYFCMIDLLGRAGQLDKAEQLINKMPFESVSAWLSLLASCRIHGDVERAEQAAKHVFDLDEENASPYALLASIHASLGRWDDVGKARNAMIAKGVKKVPGHSYIEVKNVIHEFADRDRMHPQQEHIYVALQNLGRQMEEAAHVPPPNAILNEIDQEHEGHMFSYHSEKLAIPFGLISTLQGTPIRITKNLQVCSDCHCDIEFISKVVQQEIIIRDVDCFHFIEDGVCSCGNFW